MNIYVPKKFIKTLYFILDYFIETHIEHKEIYEDEIFIAKKILKKLK